MATEDRPAKKTGTAEAHGILGRALRERGRLEESAASYREATALDPGNAAFHNDLGNVLAEQGKLDEAIVCYQKALETCPEYAEAHNNLANLYQMTGRMEEAASEYQKAIGLRPDYAEAHRNLGSLFYRQGRLSESISSLRSAVSLNPAYAEAIALLEHQMRHMCEWKGLDAISRSLIRLVEQGSGKVNPFGFLCLESSPAQQLLCARQWAAQNAKYTSDETAFTFQDDGQITVGYLSADFHEHATAHLISELFSLHDRKRFRIVGYSYGPDDGGPARERLIRSFDQFEDIRNESFVESARRICSDGVQILVDLKGYTADARPRIMALRPAPIQVNYLGYPGTMGSDAIDYLIVDDIVVPQEEQTFFVEKLVHMPDCYQVNDSARRITERNPSRHHCRLPENGFVFCCFNASYKITPKMFNVWTRLLKVVPGSVLWLLDSSPEATANLRREAEARGVKAERLVFAGHLPYADHLARFAVADLFLDTFPYNAHTLASDALWGGCPVLTYSGRTFPSRVAGSLLRSVGLPELVCGSLAEYERLALALAYDPGRLRGVRQKLQANRLEAPVFDTLRFARHLEIAFERMWELYRRAEPPRPFAVSEVMNSDRKGGPDRNP